MWVKTKEMLFDFRRSDKMSVQSVIHGENVEIVQTYTYLGTVFDDKLTWDKNTDVITKKGQQRMHLLRKLRSFSVNDNILSTFYRSFIESVLCFSFICYFFNLNVKNKNSLNRIVNVCSKICGRQQRGLDMFCRQQISRKVRCILSTPDHVFASEFDLLPSGRRYRAPSSRTNRYKFSFIPVAIRLLNERNVEKDD